MEPRLNERRSKVRTWHAINMTNKIINRVANSNLAIMDLEALYPTEMRVAIDIKQWLSEELILREKPFREALKQHHWEQYKNTFVYITCSTEAIIPDWAYMLISLHVNPYAKKVVLGNLNDLETHIFNDILAQLNWNNYKNKPVIVKGCSKKPVPKNALIQVVNKLQPIAKSISFGEACSAVPLYKNRLSK